MKTSFRTTQARAMFKAVNSIRKIELRCARCNVSEEFSLQNHSISALCYVAVDEGWRITADNSLVCEKCAKLYEHKSP